MDIHPTRVVTPDPRLLFTAWGRQIRGMVTLHPNITHGEPRCPERTHQPVTVVLQRLQPGTGTGTHREAPSTQPQRTAMGSQLFAHQLRPGLPESSQIPFPPPLVLKRPQAPGQRFKRPEGSRDQHRHLSLTSGYGPPAGAVPGPLRAV